MLRMASITEHSQLYSLLMILIQTFSVIGLGYLCFRAKYINPEHGDMAAVRFYISWIGMPLLVFAKLSVANLGDLQWSVILACTLTKFLCFTMTYSVTWAAFKTGRSRGQRILTASTFAFASICANDLAIGFPVMHAMYGPKMEIYIAANVFVFQAVIQPLCIMLFEVGKALKVQEEECSAGTASVAIFPVVKCACKGILQNVIILATVAGLAYEFLLGSSGWLASTLEVVDGVAQFPQPMQGVVELWTGPFTFFFLFMNGTSLSSTKLSFWTSFLVLMKAVVSAYLCYALGVLLIPSDIPGREDLVNFTFFYGSLPSAAGALVFADRYDPTSMGLLASGLLYCMFLSGPIEIVTALFLGTKQIQLHDVAQVQLRMAQMSIFSSAIVLLVLVVSLSSREEATFSWVKAGYAATVCLYDLVTMLMQNSGWGCGNVFLEKPFGFLQNACFLIVLYMQYLSVAGRRVEQHNQIWRPCNLVILAVLTAMLALALPYYTTLSEVCAGRHTFLSAWGRIVHIAFLLVLFGAGLGIAVWDLVLKHRERSLRPSPRVVYLESGEELLSSSACCSPEVQRLRSFAEVGWGVTSTLVVLQLLRLLMEMLNSSIFLSGMLSTDKHPCFTPMLMLVNVLEHGQGVALLLSSVFQGDLGNRLQKMLQRCGWRPRPVPTILGGSWPNSPIACRPPQEPQRPPRIDVPVEFLGAENPLQPDTAGQGGALS